MIDVSINKQIKWQEKRSALNGGFELAILNSLQSLKSLNDRGIQIVNLGGGHFCNVIDINEIKKIAWDWAQGVDDAETAIRKLNKLFPFIQ